MRPPLTGWQKKCERWLACGVDVTPLIAVVRRCVAEFSVCGISERPFPLQMQHFIRRFGQIKLIKLLLCVNLIFKMMIKQN